MVLIGRMDHAFSINRIRLEFKVVVFSVSFSSSSVLIESDWNLKSMSPAAYLAWIMVLIESDWNLKPIATLSNAVFQRVLIESDWNLKSVPHFSIDWFKKVLIESDWNLKYIYVYH